MNTATKSNSNIREKVAAITGIDSMLLQILSTELAIQFIDKLSVEEGKDMSHLVTLNMFWAVWERKWNEVDTLFINRLCQKTQQTAFRVTDIGAAPLAGNMKSKPKQYHDYHKPFYYKSQFDSDEETIIFNLDEMLYHYTTLHQCSEVQSWAMQSLIYLYKFTSKN
jgi:hypothetical protein